MGRVACFPIKAHLTPAYISLCRDEEPPRKKRRSKWDITPPDAPQSTESSQQQQPPASSESSSQSTGSGSSAAVAAAAKINAMLAKQGKLLKSDPPLAKVSVVNMYTKYVMYTVFV